MKFFREAREWELIGSRRTTPEEVPDIEIPGLHRRAPIPHEMEEDEVEYVKRESQTLFRTDRSALPQWFIDPRVQVRTTPHMGKGCFTLGRIERNTLIESAPVILVHGDTFANLNEYNGGTHKLSEYPFAWGRDGMCAIALGYGGIYNHSHDPNVTWRPSYEHESIQYTACRDIEEGEEIFIRYLPLNKLDSLWFEDPNSIEVAGVWRDQTGPARIIDIRSISKGIAGKPIP